MASPPLTVFSFRRRPDQAKDAQLIYSDAPVRQILDGVPPSPPAEVLQPAGSHHPAWLAATIGQSPGDRDARVKSLWTGKRLVGVFAYREQRWRWPWPQRVVVGWQSKLTFDGTPLIHRSHARTAIKTFIREQQGSPILFQTITTDGAFFATLMGVARDINAPSAAVRVWERAALRPVGTFDGWFESNFSRKRRKEYRRIRTRLAEQGKLAMETWNGSEPIERWIDELLSLEAKGWKGRQKTAILNNARMEAALTRALHSLAREGSLRFWKLSLNGEPVAMMFALVSGAQAWLGKIAYDENYARHSPGVLLILDVTKALFEEPGIRLVDSCAIPGHPMIDNIWRERIQMCDVLIGAPGMSPALFALMVGAEHLRDGLRTAAKTFYYSITRKRIS